MARSLVLALSLVWLVSTCLWARAAEPDPAPAVIEALVRQLGSDSIQAREEAARKLAAHGMAAVSALKAGLKNPDAEVRTRCQRILTSVLALDFENRMQAFVTDTEGKEHKLPGWNRYRKVVGEDKASRELFVEMLRSEAKLLEASEKSPKDAGDELNKVYGGKLQVMFEEGNPEDRVSLGFPAAVFLVGSDPAVSVDDNTASLVYTFLQLNLAVQESLGRAGAARAASVPHAKPLRRLLAAWVGRPVGFHQAELNVHLAREFDVKEGLGAALHIVKNVGTKECECKAFAIVLVGKLGSQEHLPDLEKLLGDTSVCAATVHKIPISTETRDVALAVMVHLTGQKLKDYGFDRAKLHPQNLFMADELGFSDPAKRHTALQKWREWQAAQKKS